MRSSSLLQPDQYCIMMTVGHAAPYCHFADKQALIAAINEEGLHRLAVLTIEHQMRPYTDGSALS